MGASRRNDQYDLVVIGAGSGGLVGADFAATLGARVALVEADRIGGDCTWTGCVPSKALLKAGRVAHEVRTAGRYGIDVGTSQTNMEHVRRHVRDAIEQVYRLETPEVLSGRGIDVIEGRAEFTEPHVVKVGGHAIMARRFLVCTGAGPAAPPIPGLADVSFLTYETIFDNDRLPKHLVVIGAGPIGLELSLAYRRLGADVTVIGMEILPREEEEVRSAVKSIMAEAGVRCVQGTVVVVRGDGGGCRIESSAGQLSADALLVATGRAPRVSGLGLDEAGVVASKQGIRVDRFLRTSQPHIYGAGDVTGGPQFTHYAGWQAFQAVRNALLPGRSAGHRDLVPRVTFLDPEVAHVGLTEERARARYSNVQVHRWPMDRVDRAAADGETAGFLKLVTGSTGRLLGATAIAARGGELIGELALALQQRMTLSDVGGTIHAYPTWSTPVQQLAADAAVAQFKSGLTGRLALRLAGLGRG